jgi:hypothetical protein
MVEHALAAGLLHDIGELYVNPSYQTATRMLEPAEFRHVASHPLIGAMLLQRLADYPEAVCRAVREHHERLDGTGYPGQQHVAALSPLGQMLAMVELMLGLGARGPDAAVATSFVLRFMPAEINSAWSGPVVRAAQSEPAAPPQALLKPALSKLARMYDATGELLRMASDLSGSRNQEVARIGARVVHRLHRLRQAGHDMGLWQSAAGELTLPEQVDIGLALQEVHYRLTTLQRDCVWPESHQSTLDDPALLSLWLQLEAHLMTLD